jgi:hypothetical protein
MNPRPLFAALALGVLTAFPAFAQQVKTVDGLVINFGLMSAEQAFTPKAIATRTRTNSRAARSTS